MQLPFEKFQALNVLAMCRHIFTRRIPGIHVSHDKAEALKRLESAHLEIRNAIGIGDWPLLTAQLSPCIRPPHFEVDFAADIIRQCQTAGLNEIHDSGVCTACNLDAYYSYRAEKGRTGRMLALLGLANS